MTPRSTPHGMTRLDQLHKCVLEGEGPARPLPRVLGRAFRANPLRLPHGKTDQDIVTALDALATGMGEVPHADGPAVAGMTFFGQFVDHDITLDVTSALGRRIDPSTIPNVRTPALDLDCVYGAGPEGSPHLYGAGAAEHLLVFGTAANATDLARTAAGKALIGDPRNDENLIVSKVQGLFIQLHNILMAKVLEGEGEAEMMRACAHMAVGDHVWADHVPVKLHDFETVRLFIRQHYQFAVWEELVRSFCTDEAMAWARSGAPLPSDLPGAERDAGLPVMPVEFAGAGYRFGHVTVRDSYDLTAEDQGVSFLELVDFGRRTRDVDLSLFFAVPGAPAPQKARPVGPHIAGPLLALPFVHAGVEFAEHEAALSQAQAAKLPLRNLCRDRFTYQLIHGQRMADCFGIAKRPAVPKALADAGFTKTPLWFYCMQEAAEFGGGCLTGAGGRLVAKVFDTLLEKDPTTYRHVKGFAPWKGFAPNPGDSVLGGIVKYVAENPLPPKYAAMVASG